MYGICRAQAIGAWRLLGRLIGHDPLPKTLKGTAQAGVGCCLFPFLSMIIWIFVLMVWATAGLTLGSYALLMSIGWGLGALFPHQAVMRAAPAVREPTAPMPPPLNEPEKDEAYWDAYVARVTAGKSERWLRSHVKRS